MGRAIVIVFRQAMCFVSGANVEGNRRAEPMHANEKVWIRRVRLTVGLGPGSDGLEEEKLVIAEVKVLNVSTGDKPALLEQALGGDVRSVGGDVKLRLHTAALKLREQCFPDTGTTVLHPDHEQGDETLLEERVAQNAEAENLVGVNGHHTLASAQGRLNEMSAIRVGAHKRIHKADARKVSSACATNGVRDVWRERLHGP